MLYIHSLKDLTPKSAGIECTSIIRELKKNNKLPLTEEMLEKELTIFFVSKTDVLHMETAVRLIPETLNEIITLSKTSKNIEPINLKRATDNLNDITLPLQKNLDYARRILEFQELFIPKITQLLNMIPTLKTEQDKSAFDERMSAIFLRILRNKKDIMFNYSDIVNEAEATWINNLVEGINNGNFFHTGIEEQLIKKDAKELKKLPKKDSDSSDAILKKIIAIKDGVDRAYEANMRMVNMAVVLYAYIEWLNTCK